jgi:DNA-binding MarR family transcriptional regulator
MQPTVPSSAEDAVFLFAAQLGRQFRKHQPGDRLDVSTWPVLHALQMYGELRLSELAAKLQLDISTVSRHVKQLEGRGLVERADDPDDRRATLLRATTAGLEVLDAGRRRRRELVGRVLAGWPAEDVAVFADLATRFTQDLARMLDVPEGST